MKRKPTLADVALASDPLLPVYVKHSWREQTRDWLRLAKRFVLDESAARYLGRMIHEQPRVVADAQDFAIPPYQCMWVEMPYPPFYAEVAPDINADPPADVRVGYLFNGPTVRVVAEGSFADGRLDVGVLPIQYRLHSPMTQDEQVAVADALHVSRVGLDLWFWGSTSRAYAGALCANADDDAHAWDRAGMRALRDNHSATLAPAISPEHAHEAWAKLMLGSAGDLRNIVALLLFLNRTSNITLLDAQPTTEGFIHRKPRPLLSHRDVRGHFCHDRVAREGCPHGQEHERDFGEWWEEYDVLRWRCTHCGGKRWWRHEHKRGEHKIGAVVQEYEVTK